MWLFVVESQKAFQLVRYTKCLLQTVALIWCLKNALIDRGSLSKTRLFTAKTPELKLLGFYSYLPWSFVGCGINCLFSHRLHDRCSRIVQFASYEISFLQNADFQTAARFPELLPVLIICNSLYAFLISNVVLLQNIHEKEQGEQRLPPGLCPWKLMKWISFKVFEISLLFFCTALSLQRLAVVSNYELLQLYWTINYTSSAENI